jgi:glycosyltransferase involved in cell wall biosynthesis
MISFIIPSYNNLKHLKNVYESIQKHAPDAEIVLLDDGSTDNTWEWIQELIKYHQCKKLKSYRSDIRIGHTILYDKGIELATNDIVGILHADMIISPNYVENLIKHLQPGKVVCATRIEPPLHPEGNEKIIKDFGMDFNSLNISGFESYCQELQIELKDKTTRGMFAPWVLYKKDFQNVGGHDPLFAPFPYEDSDIFQRWILAGYELIQSRDAFVYHLTCRGHRWNKQVGKDDEYYKLVSQKSARNYIRKWGSWIKNNEYQYPIISPKYNIAYVVKKCNLELLKILEPWCDRIYIEDDMNILINSYIKQEQPNTSFNLNQRVLHIKYNYPKEENDIVVEFNTTQLTQQSFQLLQQLPDIIKESGEIGEFELDIFKINIKKMKEYQNDLIYL